MQCTHAYLKSDSKYIYCDIEEDPRGKTLDDTTPSMCIYQEFPPWKNGNKVNLPTWTNCEKLKAAIDRTKTVLPSEWVADGTYTDYPYRAAIPVTGATADMFPYVEFEQQEAESGNYADISTSDEGVIYIYCREIPANEITVTVYLYLEEYVEEDVTI